MGYGDRIAEKMEQDAVSYQQYRETRRYGWIEASKELPLAGEAIEFLLTNGTTGICVGVLSRGKWIDNRARDGKPYSEYTTAEVFRWRLARPNSRVAAETPNALVIHALLRSPAVAITHKEALELLSHVSSCDGSPELALARYIDQQERGGWMKPSEEMPVPCQLVEFFVGLRDTVSVGYLGLGSEVWFDGTESDECGNNVQRMTRDIYCWRPAPKRPELP